MNKREQQKEETLKEILRVSTKLFHEKGYENTSIQNIADGCGLSKGALYHHFKSKEEVLERISLDYYKLMKETFLSVVEKKGMSMSEKIRQILILANNSDLSQGSVTFAGDSPEPRISTVNAAMEKLFRYYSEKIYIELFSPLFEQGRSDGECSFSGPAENMALFIHHLDCGMIDQIRRIIYGGGSNAQAELKDLIDGLTYSISKLLNMPEKDVEEMIMVKETFKKLAAVIDSQKKTSEKHNNFE